MKQPITKEIEEEYYAVRRKIVEELAAKYGYDDAEEFDNAWLVWSIENLEEELEKNRFSHWTDYVFYALGKVNLGINNAVGWVIKLIATPFRWLAPKEDK